MENLPKLFFWFTSIILTVILLSSIYTVIQDKNEYINYNQKAIQENDPEYCKEISNFRYATWCYASFVKQGYECTTDACFIAYAVFIQDDWYCDKVFSENKLQLNLECRVSVFIERYTHEGLSDCCHAK